MKNKKKSINKTLLLIWMVLFVFKDLLSEISSVFSYIDETPLLILALEMFVKIFRTKKIEIKKTDRYYFAAILLFIISGIIGNVVYNYQSIDLVVIDLIANVKFFFALAYFERLAKKYIEGPNCIPRLARILSAILFGLFLLDRLINIFPAEYRYGIKSNRLYFGHPTYLAGICVFLIALMTIYNIEKNILYIGMNLIMLVFTLRSKAIVGAVVFILLYVVIIKLHAKLKSWHFIVVALIGVACAWSQIYFYFIYLGGQSARSVMLFTSFLILKDYFPIGTGFGTFASHSAAVNYSPVYIKYGFNYIYELRNSADGTFFDDQFWPIVFGQTGFIGSICYIYIVFFLFRRIQKMFRMNLKAYTAGLFVFTYLMISSIAEPAFNNSVSIPLAMVLGICYSKAEHGR